MANAITNAYALTGAQAGWRYCSSSACALPATFVRTLLIGHSGTHSMAANPGTWYRYLLMPAEEGQ